MPGWRPHIQEWEWDEWNLAELAGHGADEHTVLSVWTETPWYRKNTKGWLGYRMIGPDGEGTIWSIMIRPVNQHLGVWRAVTGLALENGDDDMAWYKQRTRKGRKK